MTSQQTRHRSGARTRVPLIAVAVSAVIAMAGCGSSSGAASGAGSSASSPSPSGGSASSPASGSTTGGASGSGSGTGSASGSAASQPASGADTSGGAQSGSFDLDKLVKAAKAEGSVVIYDSSGGDKVMAKNFGKKYGIKATSVKSSASDTVTKLLAASQSGNYQMDVAFLDDGPTIESELVPQGIVKNWVPPDLASKIPQNMQEPLVFENSAIILAYNSQQNPNGCPISNIWQLTLPKWKGKMYMKDPLNDGVFTNWFSAMSQNYNSELAALYQKQFGKAYDDSKMDAAHAFVKALAENSPNLVKSSSQSADAIGQKQKAGATAPLGFLTFGKFDYNKSKGYHLASCAKLKPWAGISKNKYIVEVSKPKHPAAAKLYIHYVLTQEGYAPIAKGKGYRSSNPDVTLVKSAWPPNMTSWDQLCPIGLGKEDNIKTGQNRQAWQDFWRTSIA